MKKTEQGGKRFDVKTRRSKQRSMVTCSAGRKKSERFNWRSHCSILNQSFEGSGTKRGEKRKKKWTHSLEWGAKGYHGNSPDVRACIMWLLIASGKEQIKQETITHTQREMAGAQVAHKLQYAHIDAQTDTCSHTVPTLFQLLLNKVHMSPFYVFIFFYNLGSLKAPEDKNSSWFGP